MSELSDLRVGDEVGYYQYGRLRCAECVTRITAKYVEAGGRLYSKDTGRLRGGGLGDSDIQPLTAEDRNTLALRDELMRIDHIAGQISERVRVLKNLSVAVDVKAQLQSILSGLFPKEEKP